MLRLSFITSLVAVLGLYFPASATAPAESVEEAALPNPVAAVLVVRCHKILGVLVTWSDGDQAFWMPPPLTKTQDRMLDAVPDHHRHILELNATGCPIET